MQKQRQQAMQALAATLGFTYAEEATCDLSGLPLFERGRSRRGRNALTGSTGSHPVILMDYQYTTGSGKNSSTHRQTVALFPEAGRELPELELAPENLLHKIGQVFGYQDIDFDADAEFSQRCLLRGSDETRIRGLFGSPLRKTWCAEFAAWTLEVRGGRVLAFRPGQTVATDEIRTFLTASARIVDALRARR